MSGFSDLYSTTVNGKKNQSKNTSIKKHGYKAAHSQFRYTFILPSFIISLSVSIKGFKGSLTVTESFRPEDIGLALLVNLSINILHKTKKITTENIPTKYSNIQVWCSF